MELRPLGRMQGFFLPLARLTSDPMDQAGSIAYANYYSLPAGVMAAFFLLLCALFLLGLYNGVAAWRLLLLIFASAGLAVGPMTEGYGAYFLPETLWRILSDQWLQNLAALAVLAYLLSSREREFWRWLGRVTLWSAAALLACYLVSLATGGYLAIYLNAEVSALFSDGIYRGLLFWLTRWLVAACALLSAFELARRLSRAQAEARALAVKDRVMAENYRSLLEKHHDTAVMRHEWKTSYPPSGSWRRAGTARLWRRGSTSSPACSTALTHSSTPSTGPSTPYCRTPPRAPRNRAWNSAAAPWCPPGCTSTRATSARCS